MQHWYYLKDAGVVGPLELPQLQQLMLAGKLQSTDLVWCQTRPSWQPARTVPELFPAPPTPPVVPPPVPERRPTPPALPSRQWFCYRDEQQTGPHSRHDLKQLASKKQLKRTDLVWCEGTPDWIPAGKVPGLFRPSTPELDGEYTGQDFEKLWQRITKVGWPLLGAVALLLLVPDQEFKAVAFLVNLVTLAIVTNLLLYRMWDLIQDGPARTTPGKAVGFRFIPFFSTYWEFVAVKGLREDLIKYARRRGLTLPSLPENVFSWYCGLCVSMLLLGWIPIIGFLAQIGLMVLQFYVLYLLKNAAVVVADGEDGEILTAELVDSDEEPANRRTRGKRTSDALLEQLDGLAEIVEGLERDEEKELVEPV